MTKQYMLNCPYYAKACRKWPDECQRCEDEAKAESEPPTNLPTSAKSCFNCKHHNEGYGDKACDYCHKLATSVPFGNWEPVEAIPAKYCGNCRYSKLKDTDFPCENCTRGGGWMDEWQLVESKRPTITQFADNKPIEPPQIAVPDRNVSEDPVKPEQTKPCQTCKHMNKDCPTCPGDTWENWQAIEPDPVDSPAHYNHGGIETIDIIRSMLTADEFRGYLKGNVLKYRERAPYKGKTDEDYAKAKKYHDWLMEAEK